MTDYCSITQMSIMQARIQELEALLKQPDPSEAFKVFNNSKIGRKHPQGIVYLFSPEEEQTIRAALKGGNDD